MDQARLRTERGGRPATARTEELVLALTRVPGCTAACATHGVAETVAVLADYYAVAADAAAGAGGRVIKVMGDGILLTFPSDRARDAVKALSSLQARGTRLWQEFDDRCRVEVKVGAGTVVCAPLGPPGEERADVYGDPLNRLFKAPWGDLVVTPEVDALLE